MKNAAAKRANPFAALLGGLKRNGRRAAPDAAPVDAARARFAALGLLWGDNRLRPCAEATDAGLALAVAAGPDARLAQYPAGLGASARIISERTGASVDGYEDRPDVLAAMDRKAAPQLDGHLIDLAAPVLAGRDYDGAVGFDLAAAGDDASALLKALHDGLKPGAILATHEIVARWSNHSALAPCRRTPWGPRRFVTEDDAGRALAAAGFELISSDDATESLADAISDGFARLRSAAPDLLESAQKDAFARAKLMEIAASAACWMPAASLLAEGKLFARRLVVRRPA
jgi:hypothetical protein